MRLDQFTVVHHFPANTFLSDALQHLRREAKLLSREADTPKLGNHLTLLPPFRAHPDEMRQFSMGLEIAQALYEDGGAKRFAETHGLDFFRNPGSDALVVKVLLPRNYHVLIEACRKQLSRFNEWVFPVLGGSYAPHICILEGKNLYTDLSPSMSKLGASIFLERFDLGFPKIMVKVLGSDTTRWQEFDLNT